MLPDFGLAGGNGGVAFQQRPLGREPAGRHFHIGVEQHIVTELGPEPAQRHIVPFAETQVAAVFQHPHRRKFGPHNSHRIVGGGIVGHEYGGAGRMGQYAGQKLAQVVAAVPVEDDHGYIGAALGAGIRGQSRRGRSQEYWE